MLPVLTSQIAVILMFRFLFALIFLFVSVGGHAQAPEKTRVSGALEHWSLDEPSSKLSLTGWVLAGQDGTAPPGMKLSILGTEFQAKDVAWTARPELSADSPYTGGQVGVGFDWTVTLPAKPPGGVHVIRLEVVYPGGQTFLLQSSLGGSPELIVKRIKKSHWWALGIVLVVVLLIRFGRLERTRLARRLSQWTQERTGYLLIVGAFAVLVTTGITGSSMNLLLESPIGQSLLSAKGSQARLFDLRDIRGDEWGVLMPNVLAQVNHEPQFPVVNTNIGLSGQNMGVIGMTGVPITNWAALAKPATWGYFLLPLRQAMSWQWQLPFWGGLLSVWLLLNVLRPDRRGLNLALSFAFCVAPYAAAWSNWPLYATMFPALGFVLACKLMQTTRRGHALLLGLGLGWLMACWFLVLYPTWLIIVGSLLLFVGVGWCLDNRDRLHWGMPQVLGAVAAGVVAAALLGSWWMDTHDAVALMRATEYPGKRGALPGGDLDWLWHLRGYNNADIVTHASGAHTDQSSASSYFLLPLMLLVLCVSHLVQRRERRWAVAACTAFIACYWIYGFVGVPIWLAKYTLWGNMPTFRMDVGMGLVSVVLITLAAEKGVLADKPAPGWWTSWLVPALAALGSAVVIAWMLYRTPLFFMPEGSWVYTSAMVIVGTMMCWWMLRGKVGAAVAMLIAVHLLATLTFNPVLRAPKSVSLAEGSIPYVINSEGRHLRTILLNGDGIGPHMLAAAGFPISNGVLYYPHKELWSRMGLPEKEWPVVNRYQHLGFYTDASVENVSGYRASAASVDYVRVDIHPQRFDFSKTGAQRVVVEAAQANDLRSNASLTWMGEYRRLHWFAIKKEGR
ncbi:hypothetical protein [Delftia sp. JD2]|uniref:DUF7657 domain-containing protein n=1 Tax=Delftia sp. JD2 TaxID=469553 RepID=UPI0008068F70|nr:hypothetical protein [Delftia sp. JD2]OBY83009.1 hypothetical protein ACM14_23265 [Delftia sp. JD2]